MSHYANHAKPCPPSCALACRVPAAWWTDVPPEPDPWHVAWALLGLDPRRQPPMHPSVHREALRWFAGLWGPDVVIRGVRLAASIPRPHGSPVEPAQLAEIADRLDAEGVSAWAAA